MATAEGKVISDRAVSSRWPAPALTLASYLALGAVAICLGLLASMGFGLILIVVILMCGAVIWVAPRFEALPAILIGVSILPSSGMSSTTVHGIPVVTSLGAVTLCGTVALWWHRKALGSDLHLNNYAVAALFLLIVAGIVQLSLSRWAEVHTVYQLFMFWFSGLLLGSILASDERMVDRLALLVLPLAIFAIAETVLRQPNIWSNLVGATHFDYVPHAGGDIRASSTFGQPVVAGTALMIMAFVVFSRPGRSRAVMFSLIVAGALTTVSRSALLGLAAGLLVYFVGSHRQRLQVIGAVIVTVAVGWIMIASVPALTTSFETRVLTQNVQGQERRLNGLHTFSEGFSQNNPELDVGRGLGGSRHYLEQTGGNLGLGTYDNQYVTSSYDSGIFVVLVVIGLIIAGVIRARPSARKLAPLIVAATTIFFFDGFYWNSTGLFFWLTVGLATAPTIPAVKALSLVMQKTADKEQQAALLGV